MYKTIILFLYVCLLVSCAGGGKSGADTGGLPMDMKYAELLVMREADDFVQVEIRNPWDSTSLLHP